MVMYGKAHAERNSKMKDAKDLLDLLLSKHLTLSVAESLTGGLLADAFVSVSGASRVFAGGAVCYQTPTKSAILGVNPHTISTFTVVSEEVAGEMAEGAAKQFSTPCAISTTGVAGPKGENDPAPVGTVCVGLVAGEHTKTVTLHLDGDRSAIRCGAVRSAISEMYDFVSEIL